MTRTARLLNRAARFGRPARLGSVAHARLYRLTGGRLLRRWFGAPVLVIETVGRRSGKPRATPLIYARDGERLVVTPANAGAERTPAWWLNLREAGRGVAVVGGKRTRVRARVAEGAERDRLWWLFAGDYPMLDDYRVLTPRDFPLVVLEPEGPRCRAATPRGRARARCAAARRR